MKAVTVYGRPGCHLCEDAIALIERVRGRVAFDLETRNIEEDDALLRAYLERIPVVVIDGEEAFELFVDEVAFERAVSEPGSASGASGSSR